MITVFNFLHKYCELRELPPPTTEDLERCGRMINHHFRHYWAIQFDGEIEDSGFTTSIENDKKIVVLAYPDIFKIEMAKRVDVYFSQKNNPHKLAIQETFTPELPVKKRKRIPAKPTKAFSVKPANISSNGQD